MGMIDYIKNIFNRKRDGPKPLENRLYQANTTTNIVSYMYGGSYEQEKGIINNLYSRIANDVSSVEFQIIANDDNSYIPLKDYERLAEVFNRPNLDQTFTEFIRDLTYTILERGHGVIVPVLFKGDLFDGTLQNEDKRLTQILTTRVGYVEDWKPLSINVSVYNELVGDRRTIYLHKKDCPIIYNPLAYIFNDKRSILRRLTSKLNTLESMDNRINSGKLDIIITLPYAISQDARAERAKDRIQKIEHQLTDSTHGIAYLGAEEKVTQLNRPANNTMVEEIKYLTELAFNQLGVSQHLLTGTETDAEREIYYKRIIYPLLNAICDEVSYKYLHMDNCTLTYRRTDFKKWVSITDAVSLISLGVVDKFEVRDMYGFDMSLLTDEEEDPEDVGIPDDMNVPNDPDPDPPDNDDGKEDNDA